MFCFKPQHKRGECTVGVMALQSVSVPPDKIIGNAGRAYELSFHYGPPAALLLNRHLRSTPLHSISRP